VPIAVNCWVNPAKTEALDGVTAIEVRFGGPIVMLLLPVTLPETAEIVAFPWATPLTSPPEVTVAIDGFEELQVTEPVKFLVLPSL